MFKKTTYSDSKIVRDVLAGNQERFEGLVERHMPSVYATALAHTRNRVEAEDVVQDTFIQAYTALDSLRAPAKFGSWVLTIARNIARSHLRKRSAPEEMPAPSQGESPFTAAQRAELMMMLTDAVSTLPDGEREAIMLHYFSGRSAREVGADLGVSRAAVLKRLERGRSRMGEHLLERLGDQETLKDAMLPSVDRITRGVIAATVAWQGTKAVAGGGILATTLAVVPKASTVAACFAGMGFAAVVGWSYLSQNSLPDAEATPDQEPTLETFADIDSITIQASPDVVATPAEETFVVAISDTESPDSETTSGAVAGSSTDEDAIEIYTSIDGVWDFTSTQNGAYAHWFSRTELATTGGDLYVKSSEGGVTEMIESIHFSGRKLTVLLEDMHSIGRLDGEVNESFTEIVLEGSTLNTGSEGSYDVAIKMIGTRLTGDDLSKEAEIEAYKESLGALFAQLAEYAADHDGEYPSELTALYPGYVAAEGLIRTNATRTLVYEQPRLPQLAAVAATASKATDVDELMKIEFYLRDQWGDGFLKREPVLKSYHSELDVRLQVWESGAISEVADDEIPSTDALPVSSGPSIRAVCANQMKQLGYSMKMFEGNQAINMMPGGLRMLYPGYVWELKLFTCPGAESSTESYELLYPGATVAELKALERAIEGVPEGEEIDYPLSRVPAMIELHDCSGTGVRHVIFYDGHVSANTEENWKEILAPYMEQQN